MVIGVGGGGGGGCCVLMYLVVVVFVAVMFMVLFWLLLNSTLLHCTAPSLVTMYSSLIPSNMCSKQECAPGGVNVYHFFAKYKHRF